MHTKTIGTAATTALLTLAACAHPGDERKQEATPPRAVGVLYTVKDTALESSFEASGTAAPLRQATLSTKLMGTVLQVLVREGDVVAAGQPLVRIDARDIAAKQSQVAASIAEAEAMERDARTQAGRMRALYADSAATRAQLDAAETGLTRAEAALRAAHAGAAELGAVSDYATIRAPFAGTVTKRFVDPGAFAAPGAPLIAVQDGSRLRISASATPDVASRLRPGQPLAATIEGQAVSAVVEGLVPAQAGNLYVVNATVANPGGRILPGSTATLRVPLGTRMALAVPGDAVTRQGDLTGVTVRTAAGDETRWVRLGQAAGGFVEVNGGLRAGEQVVVAPTIAAEGN